MNTILSSTPSWKTLSEDQKNALITKLITEIKSSTTGKRFKK
jgi:hypothetical protein